MGSGVGGRERGVTSGQGVTLSKAETMRNLWGLARQCEMGPCNMPKFWGHVGEAEKQKALRLICFQKGLRELTAGPLIC